MAASGVRLAAAAEATEGLRVKMYDDEDLFVTLRMTRPDGTTIVLVTE
jgi:hypothetical protein